MLHVAAASGRLYSHHPPQLDVLPSSASFPRVWPTSWTLLLPFGCHRWADSLALCMLHVRVLLLSGRWATARSLRWRRVLARAICSRLSSSSCSSTPSCAHCGPMDQSHGDAVKREFIFIYLLFTSSRSPLLHHMQGKFLLLLGMCNSWLRFIILCRTEPICKDYFIA